MCWPDTDTSDTYESRIEDLQEEIGNLQAENERLRTALLERIDQLQAELEKHRWIPTDDPPDNIDWDKKVQVLECVSEIPVVMTMAEIFLDEGSEAEYWKPIILPERTLKGK